MYYSAIHNSEDMESTRCQSIDEQIKHVIYIYKWTTLDIKMDEILSFAAQ